MMRQWRLVYDAPAHGAYNMAVDEAVLWAVSAGLAAPTLRLYAWSPPCVTLGRGQKSADVDFQRIAETGWHVVRRSSGGQAVLHIDEVTYSVVLPTDHPLAAGGIVESYRYVSEALLGGLTMLGLAAQANCQPQSYEAGVPVCFAIPSRYEIIVNGRKLAGHAQVRRKGGVLQHGSLPLRGDLGWICDVLAYPDEVSREQAKARVRTRAITLAEALGREVSWPTLAEAIVQGFSSALGIEFVQGQLSNAERARAQQLAREVYCHLDWHRSVGRGDPR